MAAPEKLNSTQKLRIKRQCLCNILNLMLSVCRFAGLAPIIWTHPYGRDFVEEDGQCHFFVSKFWIGYSILLIITYNGVYYSTSDFDLSTNWKTLITLNEYAYIIFSTMLTLFAIFKVKDLTNALNSIGKFLRRGLLCHSSKNALQKSIRIGFLLITFQGGFQLASMAFLYFHSDFASQNDIKDFINCIVHNVPFLFYYLFSTIVMIYIALFMCFETAMLQTLTNNWTRPSSDGDFSLLLKFTKCTGSHPDVIKHDIHSGTLVGNIDSLRRFHEAIRQSLVKSNKAFNPQLAFHLGVELGILIMHLYSTIWYFTIKDKNSEHYTGNFLNWIYVICHTTALIIFLESVHGLKLTQMGPRQQITEYSSKRLTAEEFAELRLFALKLEYAPAELTAGRLFTIDISLLAPITGSIVTYLLVALQFELQSSREGAAANDTQLVF